MRNETNSSNNLWQTTKERLQTGFRQYLAWAKANPIAGWASNIIIGGFLLGITSLVLLVLLVRVGAFGRLPSVQDLSAIQNNTASEIYAADEVLLGKYFVQNRTNVNYEDISPHLINALIATEDARFFEHQGIDLVALFRVFFKTILRGDRSSGGGSTLSQQLAKNIFKRERFSVLTIPVVKIKEMYIARRLEKVYTKEALINMYLNTVPFGGNIYGIHVAARQFFSKTPADVTIEEAAMLVGMLKANTRYNPIRNPELALQRRNVVLGQMLKYDYLDQSLVDSLQNIPLHIKYSRDSNNEGTATYFREHLRHKVDDLLEKYNKEHGTAYNLYTDGLKIYTSIDAKLQQYAEAAVAEHIALLQKDFDQHWRGQQPWGDKAVIEREKQKSRRYQALKKAGLSETEIDTIFDKPVNMTVFDWNEGDVQKEMSPMDSIKYYFCLLHAGFLAMEPQTGAIKAWVGGVDYQHFQYDHVKSKRPVGSTFKPLVYAAALEQGIEPCTYTHNRLVIYTDYEDWKPENANNQYGGVYSMEGALAKSVNSVTVSTIMKTNIDSVITLAHQMGIESDIPAVPAIALGAVDASLYEMVNVYATLANEGHRPEPYILRRIEDAEGKVLIDMEEQTVFEQVLSPENAQMITKMLQSVVDSGTARRLRYQYQLDMPIAGKTGTTQNQSDGWFIGYTPHLVAGAWVGGASPLVRFRSLALGSGSNMALPIWGRFMNKVYKEPTYAQQRFAAFRPLADSTLLRLDCAPYLDEMPIESPFLGYQTNRQNGSKDNFLKNIFGKNKQTSSNEHTRMNQSPRQRSATESEHSRKIREHNERIRKKRKRQKKREKFFDKLFGKN